jgi:hypothetical protein
MLTTDIFAPDGICIDKRNNIWIVNNEPNDDAIVEFKHGGTSPIATLKDSSQYPDSCSIDPATGDLAVTNHDTISGASGSVAVYSHAKGLPTLYADPSIVKMFFCGYDDKGNLFVDGTPYGSEGFVFAELPKGKSALKNIALKGGSINFPGQILWDGKYLAVGDQDFKPKYGQRHTSGIYRTTGAGARIVGAVALRTSQDVAGFWIDGNAVVAPDVFDYYTSQNPGNVLFFDYPAGGKPSGKLSKGFSDPLGVAISP